MEAKNTMQLSLNSDTFESMKEDFDTILLRTIDNMESRGADEATITLKLGISFEKEPQKFSDTEEDEKEIIKPTFKHDVSTVIQVKGKKSGSLSGDYELVWDEEEKKHVLVRISDNQMSLFDEEETEGNEEIVESEENEYNPEEDTSIPFGWLRQFVGEKLQVTEAMGNYTVRTESNQIILSSASEEDNPFHCDAEILKPHVGHNVVCAYYGTEDLIMNIAIECEDCFETIFSIDRPSENGEVEETEETENEDFEYDEPEEV